MHNNDLDILLELEKETLNEQKEIIEVKEIQNNYIYQTIISEPKKKERKKITFFSSATFLFKYLTTSLIIFIVLIIWTNYNAYLNIAKWFFFKEEIEKESKSILQSVEASNLKEKTIEKVTEEKKEEEEKASLSIKKYKKELDNKNISLKIEITPYENRVVIPKIGKNITLVEIKNRKIDCEHELEDIFMKELENGVVRYPGSAIPWEEWNSFIFGHSSNFPWMNGDYNEVFSNLNFLEEWDEIIIYYNQKKFKYIVKEKRVIKPGDVSVLKKNISKKELSIMTCWPIWTTLNRLVVTGEMVEEK